MDSTRMGAQTANEYRLKLKCNSIPLFINILHIGKHYVVRCNDITLYENKSERKCHKFVTRTFQLA